MTRRLLVDFARFVPALFYFASNGFGGTFPVTVAVFVTVAVADAVAGSKSVTVPVAVAVPDSAQARST